MEVVFHVSLYSHESLVTTYSMSHSAPQKKRMCFSSENKRHLQEDCMKMKRRRKHTTLSKLFISHSFTMWRSTLPLGNALAALFALDGVQRRIKRPITDIW